MGEAGGRAAWWRDLLALSRAEVWWDHKTPVVLGAALAAAVAGATPWPELWPRLLLIVGALSAAASYVCVLNDLTDEADDRRAGKANRLEGRSPTCKAMALGVCLLAGGGAAWLMRAEPLALALYVANWLVFALYSVPPVRLKVRGWSGVLADACGGGLLPVLWAAVLAGGDLPAAWLLVAGVWSLAYGLRGILFHEVLDFEADRRAGVPTLVVRCGVAPVVRWVRGAIFPVEVAALLLLLATARLEFALPLTLVYLAAQLAQWHWLGIVPVVIVPAPLCRAWLMKFYQLHLPLIFILTLAANDLRVLWLVPAHLLAFPGLWKRWRTHWAAITRGVKYPVPGATG